ncbi:MAG TPA: translation initiation factor IF-2 [Anaerohalosphaeraceae bacterium]|nr:translation initiation factor IF-2 [Anaerohalosphaeraceae bacterium]HOM75926.1 translation initiation factor IF-2 [Anaerohalosphaeraceae bacterium]HPO70338.1 translation initiation factor IF-2 [Anaerohalosphaeraceae bacterium]HRV19246.1 translation initiation factor IF-2 [Anaerohalosphaeraceae bacterium]
MAKASTRVHLLAKELNVPSKAIIEKCQAEGLDQITNHMSVISVGLAATIREWFSEGVHATTVEQAKPVDLEKVRIKRKKVVSPQEEAAPPVEAPQEIPSSVPEEVPVPQPAMPVYQEPEPMPAGLAEPASPLPETPLPQPVVEEPAAAVAAAVEPQTPPPAPQKPDIILPAGPMLEKPTPAVLTGPTVIRVEKVEDRYPKRHKGPRPPREKPAAESLLIPADLPVKGPKAGKAKTYGRKKDKSDIDLEPGFGRGDLKRLRARDLEERQARLAAARGETVRAKPSRRIESKTAEEAAVHIERPAKAVVTEPILVKDLSNALAVKVSDIIAKLLLQGVMVTANQAISAEAAELVALEYGTELVIERKKNVLEEIEEKFNSRPRLNLQKRPPIVTMLGHVDHGKTSLLDRIRKTSVAAGEAGGITQHIGAYQVELNGKKVTFLDTPGHEAFTSLRARGANMTDIVVLVVAADDGVMPQTVEAIHHAKAAGVSIIVALNKIDIPGVDVNRVYGQLASHDLTPTVWGGTTELVQTSAVTGAGIEELIELLDYQAELNDYRADPDVPAQGWIVEAKMSQTKGPVATVLVKEGTLQKGSIVLAGGACGRIRTMTDSRGRSVKTAPPSTPVEITGLDSVPAAGDKFFCLEDLNQAKAAAEQIQHITREEGLAKRSLITLDNLFAHIEAGRVKELNLIVKADVQGSVDVLIKYLTELSTDEVKVKVIHAAVGGINEGDVVLAEASSAIIIGFNVVPDERVRQIAESKKVDIRLYNIIYRITEDLKAAMAGLLEPEYKEQFLGRLVVRDIFKVSSIGTIAGCYVSSGMVSKNAKLKLIRGGIVVKDNCSIESLKHFKNDVREVKAGLECGIKVAGYDDIKIGDEFEAYEIIEVARTL